MYPSADDTFLHSNLSDDDIAEFRRLVKEETGTDLDPAEARWRAVELINLVRTLVGGERKATPTTPRPLANETGPVATVLRILADLEIGLKGIRSQSKDWAWPVKLTHHLLSEILTARIEEAWGRRPAGLPALTSWRGEGLPRLLMHAKGVGVVLPPEAERVAQQLEHLVRETTFITVQLWQVLAAQLPRLLRESLALAATLLWEVAAQTTLLSDEERKYATEVAERIDERLLRYEGEVLR